MANSIMDFIEENYEELLTFAVRINGNWADGEDVLQTVAAKICAMQNELGDLAYAKSYLMTCIRNATFNLKRTRARQRAVDTDFETLKEVIPDEMSNREFALVEWIESLDRHLRFYDEASRKAFIAYYVDQEPLEKAAASLGMTKRQATRKFENMRLYLRRHYKHLFVQLSVLLSM
ncbi:MAG: sigma-70 family RNA polymerase sigma factor [Clostridia bacterium]|nr:sigma-70 family RNA polymerase sigma factor [Clostridia bacterium]